MICSCFYCETEAEDGSDYCIRHQLLEDRDQEADH